MNFERRSFTRDDLKKYEKYRMEMGISLDDPYWVVLEDGTEKRSRKTIYITYADIHKYLIVGFDGYYPQLVEKTFPKIDSFTQFYNENAETK